MTTTMTTTKALHLKAMNRLASTEYADGTYDIDTLSVCEFSNGYQVTFCNEGDDYSDESYEFLSAMFAEMSSDGITYLGKFGGAPEVSWHFESREMAVKMAKKFNQISVWDWKHCEEIPTGGTGKRG